MTSSIKNSAPLVLTWKNDGAERRIWPSAMLSVQEPSPASISTLETRRAFFSPLLITRTMLVGCAASASTRETCERGNDPVGVQSATSSALVRREARMPTRSKPRSWLPLR